MINRSFFIFLMLLFFSTVVYSQNNKAVNSKAVLPPSKEDSNKVNLLLDTSTQYLNSDPEQAKRFGILALNLSNSLKYQHGRARALKNIGSAFYFQGNVPVTLDYYGQALQVYDSIGDQDSKAMILNNFGTVYFMKGTDDKALEYYFKSLEVAEKIGNKARMATAYSNLGSVYHNKTATSGKALSFFLKGLRIGEEIGDRNIVGAASVNLGELYIAADKDDSALFYFRKSLKAYEGTIDIPYPLRDIGQLYAKKGDFELAIQYLKQSYQIASQFDSKLDMAQSLLALANTYLKKQDQKSALKAYLDAESIAAAIPAYKELDSAFAGSALTYSQLGQFDKAYHYQKRFSSLSDTLNNQDLSDKLTSLQTNFEILTRQNQINLLTKDKKLQELDLKSQKLQKGIISGGLAVILIIALIILRNYLESARTNKLLDKQKEQIESLLQNILPAEVAVELQRDGKATPRYYEQVSVLFTDFKDFTKLADALSPQEVVFELNSCFIAFDDIIEKYHLEKIKTIGDSYMCAGGIPTTDENHPLNMIRASLDIQAYMKSRNGERVERGLAPWNLRIGVHVGPVVAGVVGRKKYAYDIWGSTVNIASRMESSGVPGQVNISAAAYELVRESYECVYRGKVLAKNIGEIDMYFVERKIG